MTRRPFRKMFLSLLVGPLSFSATPVVLDVPEVIQEQTEWCWAGTTNAVLRYYKTPLKQCEIANYTRTTATFHDFGTADCCTSPKGACNYWNYNWGEPGSIQEILKHWGVNNTGRGGSLTLSAARTELDAKRPFIVRWAYKTSGGHFVVGHGLTDSSLHYMDPWPGEGSKIAKYSWVVSNSQKDWQGTNVMTTTPVSSISSPSRQVSAAITARLSNSVMSVSYQLESGSSVDIRVRSLQGRLLHEIHRDFRAAGPHAEEMRGFSLPAGIYWVSLVADDHAAQTAVLVAP
ncbi:MAG: C39 family peptidase [Fibrobacterota bacterium]|nr:C39 family peptidase [Fibrobacterota bacterium]QQS03941.1 MAG: C39 family peptidase [Fibrobacterota bacterium]